MKILAVTVEDLPAILALQKQAFESEARLVGSYEIPPMTQTLADLEQEFATRIMLKAVMDEIGCVNIFLSEGAGVAEIVAELEAAGQEVPRDAFGHVKLDKINPGQWFGEQFSKMVGAEKTQVWKSGYFSRSAAANPEDLRLIKSCTDYAVECALRREGDLIFRDQPLIKRGLEL